MTLSFQGGVMSTWLSSRNLLTHKVFGVGKVAKKLTRKKSKLSLVKQSIKVSKKLAMGVAKLATFIFIGRL